MNEREYRESLALKERTRRVARLLDSRFEIFGIRFGLDGLIGLVPGWGDLLSMIFSLYIVGESARSGVPASIVSRMLANVIVDSAVGAVPFFGDLFDIAWRSNSRNARLLERWLDDPKRTRDRSRAWVTVVLGLGIFLLVALATVAVLIGAWFLSLFQRGAF